MYINTLYCDNLTGCSIRFKQKKKDYATEFYL